jgi:hypothetical protein
MMAFAGNIEVARTKPYIPRAFWAIVAAESAPVLEFYL